MGRFEMGLGSFVLMLAISGCQAMPTPTPYVPPPTQSAQDAGAPTNPFNTGDAGIRTAPPPGGGSGTPPATTPDAAVPPAMQPATPPPMQPATPPASPPVTPPTTPVTTPGHPVPSCNPDMGAALSCAGYMRCLPDYWNYCIATGSKCSCFDQVISYQNVFNSSPCTTMGSWSWNPGDASCTL